MKTGKW